MSLTKAELIDKLVRDQAGVIKGWVLGDPKALELESWLAEIGNFDSMSIEELEEQANGLGLLNDSDYQPKRNG